MKFIWLLSFFSVLFFLPLGHDLSRYGISSSLLWDDVGFLLGIWIIIFLGTFAVQKKFRISTTLFQITLALTLLLLLHVGWHGIFLEHFSAWFRYLIFLWLPLCIFLLCKQFSLKLLSFLLLGILCLQAEWGILQFVLQHDLGFQMLGEPQLTVARDGVAKFSIVDTKVIRAYGPYLHPNAFAGSLLAGLLLLSSLTLSHKAFYGFDSRQYRLWFLSMASIYILAIVLTFSRGAYASLLLIGGFSVWVSLRGKFSKRDMASLYRPLAVFLVATVIVFIPLFMARFSDVQDRGFDERGRGLLFAKSILAQLPSQGLLPGIGIGNYPVILETYLQRSGTGYEVWEIAPLHNAILLLMFEIGAVGVATLLLVFTSMLYRSQKMFLAFCLFLPMLPLLLLDHYMLTQTAPLVMWMAATLLSYQLFKQEKTSK
ncbi:MAG: O-antigen ligase family protein [Candidatus Andersenbacteria bacterium]|nr:O-antigen ligase family protein [Candidatus Andersenbacteria bacterium]